MHPELGPFTPPPVERFAALNAEQLARSADRDAARERWLIGTPYRGVELPTLLVRRAGDATSRSGRRPARARGRCISPSACRSPAGSAARRRSALLGVATSAPPLLAGLALAPAGLAWAAVRLRGAKKRLPLVLPLDGAARAVAEAYRELGELSPEAAAR